MTIVMHELKTSLDGALEWISRLHDDLVDTFLEEFQNVPSWNMSSLDMQVARYIDSLGNWVRANDTWSFEVGWSRILNEICYLTILALQSERYFGKQGLEIQRNRVVKLLPKGSA
jgi:hypothetical protein